MTLEELVNKTPEEIRVNETLMGFYISNYEIIFGVKPNCAGCSLKNDFGKFKSYVLSKSEKINSMNENQTFKLKKGLSDKILTYKKGLQTFRAYGNKATDDFIKEFLMFGEKEELELRKDLFDVLPKDFNEPQEEVVQKKIIKKPKK